MLGTLLLLIVGLGPEAPYVLRDSCDALEINNYHDERGELVFTQAIFRDFNGERFAVQDWRLVKRGFSVSATGCVFSDAGTLRKVTAKIVYESWTQFDPELADRELTSKDDRRGLSPQMSPRR